MPASLFSTGKDVDDLYKRVRDDPLAVKVKDELDLMWEKFKPFADKDYKKRIKTLFKPLLWEMYLAVSLLDMGFKLLPRPTHSPDICIELEGKNYWIECVMPTAGAGDDQVPERKLGEAGSIPELAITLRFTNCITEKANQFKKYIKEGIVDQNDFQIIAVNGGHLGKKLKFPSLGLYLLKCLYGIGDLSVVFDKQTCETSEPNWDTRLKIKKISGSEVKTQLFGSEEMNHISGVLYAESTTSFPYNYGHDFVMHHNPLANSKVNVNFLSRGLDFYVDPDTGDILHHDKSNVVNEHGPYFMLADTQSE